MSFSKTIRRELEVAFSKRSQSIGFRILKYAAIVCLIYYFGAYPLFWWIFSFLLICALVLHFWVRYKTHGWTKSYGLWKHEDDETK